MVASAPPDHVHAEAAATEGGLRASLRALRIPAFRTYFGGQLLSASGSWLQATAQGLLVLKLTGSPAALGVVAALQTLPLLVLGAPAGALVDRVDKRRLLMATAAALALTSAALFVLVEQGAATVTSVGAIALLAGTVSAVDGPARLAFGPGLVPPADLASAASLNGVLVNSARIVGPALAALLIAAFGLAVCFAVNAVSFLAVIVALARIPPTAPRRARAAPRGGVRAGLAYVRADPGLSRPLLAVAVMSALAFNFPVLLPVLVEQTYGSGSASLGVLQAVLAVGALAGSLRVGAWVDPPERLLPAALAGFAALTLALALAPGLAVALVVAVPLGVSWFLFVTGASTRLQRAVEPALRGRVTALWSIAYLGMTPVGALVSGVLAAQLGARGALAVGAAAAALVALWLGARRAPALAVAPTRARAAA